MTDKTPDNRDLTIVIADDSCTCKGAKDNSKDKRSTSDVNLSADESLEFRRSLENSGKRYRLLKIIAEGGFGRIFLAYDRILCREVVVKSLKENHLQQAESIRKFIAEAKLNAQLDHPAIVPLYSLDTDSADGLNLAMQLIRGVTLKDELQKLREEETGERRGRVPYEKSLQERLGVFLRICEAVDYAHSRGIVHCDLKPENIMLGQHSEVYVMDWGIACPVGTDRKGRLDGTPAYMPPETLTEGKTIPETDVFALGMILNEIVTLRKPISGSNAKETIEKIKSGQFEPSTSENPKLKISPALRAIIEKARAMNPADRYHSASALADDIRHYLFKEEVSAYPDSVLQKFMRFIGHHRHATLLLLIGVFCIFLVVVLYCIWDAHVTGKRVSIEFLQRQQVQEETNLLGVQVSNDLLRMQENLKTLSNSFMLNAAERKTVPNKREVLLASDFARGSATTPDRMIRSAFYPREISLDYPVFFKPSDMDQRNADMYAEQLQDCGKLALPFIVGSVDFQGASSAKAMFEEFKTHGSLLYRISCLMNNGFAMRYPGMYENIDKTDDLLLDKLRRACKKSETGFFWSPPYIAAHGRTMVSCWTTLMNEKQSVVGLIGFDLDYGKLIRRLVTHARLNEMKIVCMLIDGDGQLIFSTDDVSFLNGSPSAKHFDLRRPFPYPEWMPRIRASSMAQFLSRLKDDRLMRVSFVRIQETGWTLIRLIPPEISRESFRNMDDSERSIVLQDIRLEKELFGK